MERIEDAKNLADYGCIWIKGHPSQFKRLMHLVHVELDSGNTCVQRGDIYHLARQRGMRISEIRELRRDNSLWAVLTRYMVMLNPRLARALRFRRSKVDEIDLVERWHEVVGTHPLFRAESWKEAEHMVEIDDICAGQIGRM